MKRKAIGIILTLALCMSLTVPALAVIGADYGDTSQHNGAVEGGTANARKIYIINNKNELWSLFPGNSGDLTQTKLMDGVKEICDDGGRSCLLVMTDGRLLQRSVSYIGFSDEPLRESVKEEILALDAVSIVSKGSITISARIINMVYYINTKGELCAWRSDGGIDIIDTDVERGAKGFYIKNNQTLWNYYYENGVSVCEKILDDVTWFCVWGTAGELAETHFALRTDGSLWGWGNTSGGELGVSSFTTKTVPVSGGIQAIRAGVHCLVEEPVKILDGVDRLFRDEDGVHAVTNTGTVVSWGGGRAEDLYEKNPDIWRHRQQPDKQWMANAAQITQNNPWTNPYQIVQYVDGRLVQKEIEGFDLHPGYEEYIPSVARTVTLDMSLLGYDGSGTVPPAADAPN